MEEFLDEMDNYLDDMQLLQNDVFVPDSVLTCYDASDATYDHIDSNYGKAADNLDSCEKLDNDSTSDLSTVSIVPMDNLDSCEKLYNDSTSDLSVFIDPQQQVNTPAAPQCSIIKPIKWTYSTIYNDGYVVYLPKTTDGFMLQMERHLFDEPFVENYYVALRGYRNHPGDIMAQAEKEVVITPGDVLLAIEDIDVGGMLIEEVKNLFSSSSNSELKTTWLDKQHFNVMRRKHVKKGIV